MIKAIETVYHGYRFRSRLEARWAVFFDTLGIPWEYEQEGYRLTRDPHSSIDYLPDFWLPERNCFVEIKGQKPNSQEMSKARYLALNSKQDVYIFFGSIHVPEKDEISVYKYSFPDIWLQHPEHENVMSRQSERGIRILFGAVDAAETQEELDELNNIGFMDLEDLGKAEDDPITQIFIQDQLSVNALDVISGTYQMGMSISRKDGQLVLNDANEKDHALLTSHVRQNADDLLQLLEGKEDWTVHVSQSEEKDAYMWLECDAGEGFWIGRKYGYDTCHCARNHGGNPDHDSPRLIAAYNAARQARFEHKDARR